MLLLLNMLLFWNTRFDLPLEWDSTRFCTRFIYCHSFLVVRVGVGLALYIGSEGEEIESRIRRDWRQEGGGLVGQHREGVTLVYIMTKNCNHAIGES